MRTGFRGRRWLKPLVEVSLPGGHFSPTFWVLPKAGRFSTDVDLKN